MTREEQIINAAKTFEKKEGFSPIVKKARGVNSAWGIGFLEGAVWADKTMIDKACEWLEVNVPNYFGHSEVYPYLKDFRKAMEE